MPENKLEQLRASIHALRLYLESWHPAAPAILLIGAIWLAQYLVRRFVPNIWERIANWPAASLFRKVWQALPSIAMGALLTSISGDGSITDAVFGAVAGALAPVLHEMLKAAPIPYRGGKPPAADPVALPEPEPAETLRRSYSREDELTPTEPAIARRKSDPPPPETLR